MKEYMKEMRKLVGTRPIIMCGSSVIINNPAREVLMIHRTDNDTWCFPGGAVELGEKVEDTAAREVFEETGLILDSLNLFGVFSGEDLHYKYPNGDEVYIVDIVYQSDSYKGEVKLNDEGKDIRFFKINELPERISPPVRPVVEALRNRRS
ncbi:NUDIX hydrolase [Paenibacillus aceti]|uniref:DNA mismatch repair protein MutT n=1 Tax=Paenibacillus aceti TaxID=1820010 RepID=A0ABQ1VSN9_9BACL|nr:NUDIX hydrolase [Paenibacillus aceti]GGF92708.1 DNA mismatch repair protein MutT [Paenibacillus aceti]